MKNENEQTNENTNFMGMMAETIADQPTSVTENGALGHSTTGKALVDLNFSIASLRGKSDSTSKRHSGPLTPRVQHSP